MDPKNTRTKTNRVPSIGLGLAAVLLVGAVFSEVSRAAGVSDRTALIALLVIGVAMCAAAMKLEVYGWKNPFNLLGSAAGAVMLAIIVTVLLNFRVPFISNDRDAFTALSLLMGVKILIDLVRGAVSRPAPALSHSSTR